jgi:hypothetical protein
LPWEQNNKALPQQYNKQMEAMALGNYLDEPLKIN